MQLPSEIDLISNPHLAAAEATFGPESQPIDLRDTRFILLCFTNRCGSNFVAESLASDGRLNRADEFFNGSTIRDVSRDYSLRSMREYIRFLLVRAARNNTLVVKIAITQIKLLLNFGVLADILPRTNFLLVQRTDILGQAISLDIAWQNKQWSSTMEPVMADDELIYSHERVTRAIDSIIQQNGLFYKFFALNGIRAHVVNYETFVTAPGPCLQQISEWLGVAPALEHRVANLLLERQSRRVNQQWREWFLRGK